MKEEKKEEKIIRQELEISNMKTIKFIAEDINEEFQNAQKHQAISEIKLEVRKEISEENDYEQSRNDNLFNKNIKIESHNETPPENIKLNL